MFGQVGPLRIKQKPIEVLTLESDFGQLLRMLGLDVLAHVIGPFEAFVAERTVPHVLLELMTIGRDELETLLGEFTQSHALRHVQVEGVARLYKLPRVDLKDAAPLVELDAT